MDHKTFSAVKGSIVGTGTIGTSFTEPLGGVFTVKVPMNVWISLMGASAARCYKLRRRERDALTINFGVQSEKLLIAGQLLACGHCNAQLPVRLSIQLVGANEAGP